MNKTYLLLGSNIGDSPAQLVIAKQHLQEQLGRVVKESSVYHTAAWGNTNQPHFLNQVIAIETKLEAHRCMDIILRLEHQMGRERTVKNAPRVIDIDILYFNKDILQLPQLIVPHPAIQDRRFVLVPLSEISPRFVHPVLLKTNHELLLQCDDKLDVKKI